MPGDRYLIPAKATPKKNRHRCGYHEAAEKLEYHVEHVRRMMREGSIAGLKIGRTWLVKREALDSYMKRTATMANHDPRRNK